MFGQARSWRDRGLCIAQLFAHLIVSKFACVDLAVSTGCRVAGYAKTCPGLDESIRDVTPIDEAGSTIAPHGSSGEQDEDFSPSARA